MITVVKSKDTNLLAKLNREVQILHNEINPVIFKCYSQDDMKTMFDEAIIHENIEFYIAYYKNEPAGYIMIEVFEYPEAPFRNCYKVLYIEQISVVKSFQNMGIGKTLINKAFERAKEMGIKRIELDYWTENVHAGEVFKKMGLKSFNTKMYIDIK